MSDRVACDGCGEVGDRIAYTETDEGLFCEACTRRRLGGAEGVGGVLMRRVLPVLVGLAVIGTLGYWGASMYLGQVKVDFRECVSADLDRDRNPPRRCLEPVESADWLEYVPWIDEAYTDFLEERARPAALERELTYVSTVEPSASKRVDVLKRIDRALDKAPGTLNWAADLERYVIGVGTALEEVREDVASLGIGSDEGHQLEVEEIAGALRSLSESPARDNLIGTSWRSAAWAEDLACKGASDPMACYPWVQAAANVCRIEQSVDAWTMAREFLKAYRSWEPPNDPDEEVLYAERVFEPDVELVVATVGLACAGDHEDVSITDRGEEPPDLDEWSNSRRGRQWVAQLMDSLESGASGPGPDHRVAALAKVAAFSTRVPATELENRASRWTDIRRGAGPSIGRIARDANAAVAGRPADAGLRLLGAATESNGEGRDGSRPRPRRLMSVEDVLTYRPLATPEQYAKAERHLTYSEDDELADAAAELVRAFRLRGALSAAHLGREEAAVQALERVDPGDERAATFRAAIYRTVGRPARAARALDEVLKEREFRREDRVEIRLRRAAALGAAGELESARAVLGELADGALRGLVDSEDSFGGNIRRFVGLTYAVAARSERGWEDVVQPLLAETYRPEAVADRADRKSLQHLERLAFVGRLASADRTSRAPLRAQPPTEGSADDVWFLVGASVGIDDPWDREVWLDHLAGEAILDSPVQSAWRRAEVARWWGADEVERAWMDRAFPAPGHLSEPGSLMLLAIESR